MVKIKFEVLELPMFGNSPTYCNKNWKIGDIWKEIGWAHELGYWTEDDDSDNIIYQNTRTGETINHTLITDYMVSKPNTFKFTELKN